RGRGYAGGCDPRRTAMGRCASASVALVEELPPKRTKEALARHRGCMDVARRLDPQPQSTGREETSVAGHCSSTGDCCARDHVSLGASTLAAASSADALRDRSARGRKHHWCPPDLARRPDSGFFGVLSRKAEPDLSAPAQ